MTDSSEKTPQPPDAGDGRGKKSQGSSRRYYRKRRRGGSTGAKNKLAERNRQLQETPHGDAPAPDGRSTGTARGQRTGRTEGDKERDSLLRARSQRRRRRAKNRGGPETEEPVAVPVAQENDAYVEPTSVFIYTYVIRPAYQDYNEYRPELFPRRDKDE